MPVKKKKTAKHRAKPVSEIAGRIQPVKKLPAVVTALFYGRSGTGKTTLSSTFPRPLLMIDVKEKGTDSIADVPDIDVINVSEWKDIEDLFFHLRENPGAYKTVVIDTVTSLQELAMEEALKIEHKKEGEFPTKRTWGNTSNLLKRYISNYVSLHDDGTSVVFLAQDRMHDSEYDGEDQIIPEVGARVSPATLSILNAAVKVIGQTFIKEVQSETKLKKRTKPQMRYCLRIGPNSYYTSKIRKPKWAYCPDVVEDPGYDDIVKVMRGEYEPPKQPAAKKTARKKTSLRRK